MIRRSLFLLFVLACPLKAEAQTDAAARAGQLMRDFSLSAPHELVHSFEGDRVRVVVTAFSEAGRASLAKKIRNHQATRDTASVPGVDRFETDGPITFVVLQASRLTEVMGPYHARGRGEAEYYNPKLDRFPDILFE
jgi:hypothetical protein